MADRSCWNCGAMNAPDARWCTNCNSYLGWDKEAAASGGSGSGGATPSPPSGGGGDTKPEPEPGPAPEPPPDGGGEPPVPAGGDGEAGPAEGAGTTDAAAPAPGSPAVTVATPEVTVTRDEPARVEVGIENPTKVVDGYDVRIIDQPDWIDLVSPEIHLMPGASDDVELSLALRPGPMVVAQRLELSLRVSSQEDARRYAIVGIAVHVPPYGPRVGVTANPAMIRLEDVGEGAFTLHFDNRSANHPQALALAANDPEDVVDFRFSASTVEVQPGSTAEVHVDFTAPQPPPGQQRNRQLAVAATDDEGPIAATITLVQSTTAAPVDKPITVQVKPSEIALKDANDAEFDVLIDNRGGHSGVMVSLTGVDPEQRLSFAFVPAQFLAAPGKITQARGLVRADPPPPGSQATHPFTVVASDGTTDVSGQAQLEITSSAAAIATAELHANPERLDLGHHRQGQFTVEVDNRRGVRPLNVAISGRSDDGAVRATFAPAVVVVAPGAIGYSRVSFTSPHPPAGQQGTRRFHVTASDGSQDLDASVEIAQTRPNRRRPAGRWLVVLGAILVFAGTLPLIGDFISALAVLDNSVPEWADALGAALCAVLVLLSILMLFGLGGSGGGLTRKSAVLAFLLAVAYFVYRLRGVLAPGSEGWQASPAGWVLVLVGAVLAYVGGILIRSKD